MTDHGYLYNLLIRLGVSEFAASTAEFLLVRPAKILLIVVIGAVVARFGSRAICRSLQTLHRRAPLAAASPRAEQRASTLGDATASLFRWVVWAVVLLTVLDEVGVNLAPLLAGAGIAGLAIGFGAQTLVKDVIAGLFILAEDQYGVGDTVTIGDATGTVEDVTMRITRFRSVDGTVWFVPNGEIKRVGNASLEWARAIVDVVVPSSYDPELVRGAMLEEAERVAADPVWADDVIEAPEVWGVNAMAADNLTLRLVVKANPARQAAMARELRSRVSERLYRDGMRQAAASVTTTAPAPTISAGAAATGNPATAAHPAPAAAPPATAPSATTPNGS